MTCNRCNQNENTPDLAFAQDVSYSGGYEQKSKDYAYQSNVSIHADYPTFEQVSDAQFNALVREIGFMNNRIATNQRNLISMGNMDKYFGDKVTEIDRRLAKLDAKPSGSGFTKNQIEGIVESYHGDDIERLYQNHKDQESRITDGYNERKDMQGKIEKMFNDHDNFYKTLGQLGDDNRVLGDKLVEAKNERDRIEAKIKTGSNDSGASCEWWDINCKINQGTEDIKNSAITLGVLGVGAYLLLKKM